MTQITASIILSPEDVELLQQTLKETRELKALLIRRALMNQQEICEFLDISESTLLNWRNEGWFPYYNEGRVKKYDPEEVLKAYKAHFAQPTFKGIELNSQKRRVS